MILRPPRSTPTTHSFPTRRSSYLIDSLAARIASARTWSYIAHRSDWLANPADMAARTRALEEKLSDALHERLTQRFVDRRTAVLLQEIDRKSTRLNSSH